MGGGGDTKKTLEQVKTDLYNKLVANAKALLLSDFNVDLGDVALEEILKELASKRFSRYYGYEFSDLASDVKPPNNTGKVYASGNICNITPPENGQVSNYLKAGVFSKLDLPEWMKATAETDLEEVATIIASTYTNEQWRYQEYQRTYDARVEDQDNFICNSVLVYCYGTLIEDGTQADIAVIYYAGVYYSAESDTKIVRDGIQNDAYKSAATLAGVGTVPTTDQQLKDALDLYSKGVFSNNFKYQFGDVPPDSYKAQGSDASYVGQNSQLRYIPDAKTDQLRTYLEKQVFAGLDIPLKSIKDKAIQDTYDQYVSILGNASSNSWMDTRLDYTYAAADVTTNPIRQQGLILCWTDQKTTDNQTKISVTYIYIMVMYYDIPSSDILLSRDMFKILVNNLRQHIEGTGQSEISDPAALKEYMLQYATQEWQKSFEFDYAGSATEPPNKKPGGKVEAYQELLQIKSYPAPEQEVKDWMDAEVFKRTDKKFPDFAMGPIYDDIVSHMLRYGSDDVPKDNNWWYTANFDQQYYDPDITKGRDVQQYAFYLYALGDMTLNTSVGETEGVHLRRLFVFYLGVFSSYQEKDPWKA